MAVILAIAAIAAGLLVPAAASAHCPLCTAGMGALAVAAAWLGVDPASIGVFVGAFAVATGLWAARLTWKFRFPFKRPVFGAGSFLLTVVPLAPLFDVYGSIPVYITGGYGTLLNRTYLVNLFVAGCVIGGVLLALAPAVSGMVSSWRGRTLPFQGMVMSVGLLLIASVAIGLIL